MQGEYLWGKDVGKIAGGGGCGGKDVAADYPAYNKNGLPKYVQLKKVMVAKKCPDFKVK